MRNLSLLVEMGYVRYGSVLFFWFVLESSDRKYSNTSESVLNNTLLNYSIQYVCIRIITDQQTLSCHTSVV